MKYREGSGNSNLPYVYLLLPRCSNWLLLLAGAEVDALVDVMDLDVRACRGACAIEAGITTIARIRASVDVRLRLVNGGRW